MMIQTFPYGMNLETNVKIIDGTSGTFNVLEFQISDYETMYDYQKIIFLSISIEQLESIKTKISNFLIENKKEVL